ARQGVGHAESDAQMHDAEGQGLGHGRLPRVWEFRAVARPLLWGVFLAGWGAIVLAALWRVREPAVVRVAAFASAPLVLVMLLWSLYANLTQPGTLLGRIPLLNPLDLIML